MRRVGVSVNENKNWGIYPRGGNRKICYYWQKWIINYKIMDKITRKTQNISPKLIN